MVWSRSQLADLRTQNGGYRVREQQFPVVPIQRRDRGIVRDVTYVRVAEDASFCEIRRTGPYGFRRAVFQQDDEFVMRDCARLRD